MFSGRPSIIAVFTDQLINLNGLQYCTDLRKSFNIEFPTKRTFLVKLKRRKRNHMFDDFFFLYRKYENENT